MSEQAKVGFRTKREAFVSCLSCGQTTLAFVFSYENGGLHEKTRCPKCSNTAYTHNLGGLWEFMQAAAKDIARIKLDMIDLQDDGEDR